VLLNRGPSADTPIALPTNAKSVRFFSNNVAEVKVDTRNGNSEDVHLTYDSARTVDVPDGINGFVAHRIDAGSNDVSFVINT
jgi:hypothetical protein